MQKLLPRDPDTEFEYSNSGYVVLAEVGGKTRQKAVRRLPSAEDCFARLDDERHLCV